MREHSCLRTQGIQCNGDLNLSTKSERVCSLRTTSVTAGVDNLMAGGHLDSPRGPLAQPSVPRVKAGLIMPAGVNLSELLWLGIGLIAAGAATGVLAGLFGIGGGAVIIPILYEVFRTTGVPEAVRMPLCVGTSLAIIIPTSI